MCAEEEVDRFLGDVQRNSFVHLFGYLNCTVEFLDIHRLQWLRFLLRWYF